MRGNGERERERNVENRNGRWENMEKHQREGISNYLDGSFSNFKLWNLTFSFYILVNRSGFRTDHQKNSNLFIIVK